MLERSSEWAIVKLSNTEETGVTMGSVLYTVNDEPVTLQTYPETINLLTGWQPPLTLGFRHSPRKHGWLKKQSRGRNTTVKNWKNRFFVLDSSRLTYYEDDKKGSEVKGDIQLMGSAVALLSYSETGQFFSFRIVSGITSIVMQASTVDEMMDWASILYHASSMANGGGYLIDVERKRLATLHNIKAQEEGLRRAEKNENDAEKAEHRAKEASVAALAAESQLKEEVEAAAMAATDADLADKKAAEAAIRAAVEAEKKAKEMTAVAATAHEKAQEEAAEAKRIREKEAAALAAAASAREVEARELLKDKEDEAIARNKALEDAAFAAADNNGVAEDTAITQTEESSASSVATQNLSRRPSVIMNDLGESEDEDEDENTAADSLRIKDQLDNSNIASVSRADSHLESFPLELNRTQEKVRYDASTSVVEVTGDLLLSDTLLEVTCLVLQNFISSLLSNTILAESSLTILLTLKILVSCGTSIPITLLHPLFVVSCC